MQVIIKPKCVEKNGFAPSADAQTTACSLSHQCMPMIHPHANLPMEKKTEEDSMTSTSRVADFMLRLASCSSEPPRTPSLQVYAPGVCNPQLCIPHRLPRSPRRRRMSQYRCQIGQGGENAAACLEPITTTASQACTCTTRQSRTRSG